jgi:1-deoxyxylulose-5-phosphate synthase
MDPVRLGKSGLRISPISLGTMNFGSEVSETDAFDIMDTARDMGVFSFDCADVYPAPVSAATWGLSETIVGKWLRGKRDGVVISTKCVNRVGPGANDAGASRKHIIEACEKSLRRLGTDRIDVFYLHLPDLQGSLLDESLLALDRLVQDGKVLYLGLCNFKTWQVACALLRIAEAGLTKLTVLQTDITWVAGKMNWSSTRLPSNSALVFWRTTP